MKMEKSLTPHILDSMTFFLLPSDTLLKPVDECFWEEGGVRILVAKFLFLGRLQKVHITDPLSLVASYAKITSLGILEWN